MTIMSNFMLSSSKRICSILLKELFMNYSLKKASLLAIVAAISLTSQLVDASVRQIGTRAELDDALAQGKPVIVDISTTWCGACKLFNPTFEEVSNTYKNIIFGHIDGDDKKNFQSLFSSIGLSGFPTLVFYNAKGERIWICTGSRTKQSFIREIENRLIKPATPGMPPAPAPTSRVVSEKEAKAPTPAPAPAPAKTATVQPAPAKSEPAPVPAPTSRVISGEVNTEAATVEAPKTEPTKVEKTVKRGTSRRTARRTARRR